MINKYINYLKGEHLTNEGCIAILQSMINHIIPLNIILSREEILKANEETGAFPSIDEEEVTKLYDLLENKGFVIINKKYNITNISKIRIKCKNNKHQLITSYKKIMVDKIEPKCDKCTVIQTETGKINDMLTKNMSNIRCKTQITNKSKLKANTILEFTCLINSAHKCRKMWHSLQKKKYCEKCSKPINTWRQYKYTIQLNEFLQRTKKEHLAEDSKWTGKTKKVTVVKENGEEYETTPKKLKFVEDSDENNPYYIYSAATAEIKD